MRFLAPVAFLLFATACGDMPDSSFETQQFFLVHDAARIEGLQFLPPLAKNGPAQGAIVGDAPVIVRIEDMSGGVLTTFSGSQIGVDRDAGRYDVTWDTAGAAPGEYRIVVANPARDIGSIGIELLAGSVGNKAHNAGRSLPIKFRIDAAGVDQDGDGVLDWVDACPELAFEDLDDADCDGALDTLPEPQPEPEPEPEPEPQPEPSPGESTRITAPGEAYGAHGTYCFGWNKCGDAATCALWACLVNGYSDVVAYGDSAPCNQFTMCNLLNGPDDVEMNWGNRCEVMGVTDIDCAE